MDIFQQILEWLGDLNWNIVKDEFTGKIASAIAGVFIGWFFFFRRRLKAYARLKRGDSDDVLFQAHHLHPLPGGDRHVLLFRNLAPAMTVNLLYDNLAARDLVKTLAAKTTLKDPILKTQGAMGFEVLNDAFGHLAGHLATTPFERETWLFTMTCEDRQVVRRKCVRCFLIRPADLERFANWEWCRENIQCEQPWHWYRIVALHQIALIWKAEKEAALKRDASKEGLPLVDNQAVHRRIRPMSVGIHSKEVPVGNPADVPWIKQEAELKKLGLELSVKVG